MKFSIKDFFSKFNQIRSSMRIWSHLLKKLLSENLIFCAVSIDLVFSSFSMGLLCFNYSFVALLYELLEDGLRSST